LDKVSVVLVDRMICCGIIALRVRALGLLLSVAGCPFPFLSPGALSPLPLRRVVPFVTLGKQSKAFHRVRISNFRASPLLNFGGRARKFQICVLEQSQPGGLAKNRDNRARGCVGGAVLGALEDKKA